MLSKKEVIRLLEEKQRYAFKGKEKDFEKHVIAHIDVILEALGLPKAKMIESQKRLNLCDFSIIPDVWVKHVDDTLTIIEVKCVNHKHPATAATLQTNAIGQVLLYKTMLEAYTGGKVRVCILDQKINYRTYITVSKYCLPITLIEFQKDRIFIPYNPNE